MDGREVDGREVELTLLLDPQARVRLEQHALLAGAAEEQHLRSVYYDTPDGALARSGLTLRVRAQRRVADGPARYVQTVKSRDDGAGAAAMRGEWEWELAGAQPDPGLLKDCPACAELDPTIMEAIAGQLAPAFTTDIRRTVRRLVLDGAAVEAAIDDGRIGANGVELPVLELELELKDGPVAALYSLAQMLRQTVRQTAPLRIGVEAKAARGYRLLTGAAPAPVYGIDPRLDRQIGAAAGLRTILGSAVAALLANLPAAEGGEAEGVHQMRVALRRLRAAFVLFRPCLDREAAKRFDTELRRLGQVLGAARDWDVFCLETLPGVFPDEDDAAWRIVLDAGAHARREAAYRALAAELAGPALTDLALALSAWAEATAQQPPAALDARLSSLAPDLLERLAREVAARGRRLAHRSDDELHALRKALKKLRYGADGLAAFFSRKAVETYLKRCKSLQTRLGTLNDSCVAMRLAAELAQGTHAGLSPAADALARRCAQRRRQALRKLPDAWQKFRDAPPFWH